MNSVLVSFFVAAGTAAFVYSRMGKRVGYGNQQNVLTLVVVSFVLSFIAVLIIAKTALPQ